ncbi:GNAT family N-acetyltransferase [Paenibacillus oenotherae]|uniref:GNAT family N-acetyltransferase n=1 Tax=Paenibacillus oenotherae TaxID=1435645 RepID=A0ABS7D2C9_9BACL|nr:GNAT family N-acetyltransferase [Paenibacillus oenotherae]MBW7474013.1 GNAT family N-acetyltransferase [Paenibacillus oenotherae]
MLQEMDYRIVSADADRGAEIKDFVLAQMGDLYPPGTYYENPHDLMFFEEVYIRSPNACFFIAEDASGVIIGTAAVRPYDRRFPEVEPALGSGPVCEIVKFYIHPDKRRKGIGARLYAQAERFAREAGYAESCLHTSLYLPGGYPFWQSRGYLQRYWESEVIVHMSKRWGM